MILLLNLKKMLNCSAALAGLIEIVVHCNNLKIKAAGLAKVFCSLNNRR
jgi:hypothetical protein